MIMFIITAASAFSWFLTSQQIPQDVATWMGGTFTQPWMFLLAVNVLLLVVGCFMEPNSAILVLAPLFFPVVQRLGIDPIHFGIIVIVNLELGMLTPPLGLNLFVASGMTKLPLDRVVRAAVPFMVSMLVYLLVVTYVPTLSAVPPGAAEQDPVTGRSTSSRSEGVTMFEKTLRMIAAAAALLSVPGAALAAPKYTFKLAHVITAGTPIDLGASASPSS